MIETSREGAARHDANLVDLRQESMKTSGASHPWTDRQEAPQCFLSASSSTRPDGAFACKPTQAHDACCGLSFFRGVLPCRPGPLGGKTGSAALPAIERAFRRCCRRRSSRDHGSTAYRLPSSSRCRLGRCEGRCGGVDRDVRVQLEIVDGVLRSRKRPWAEDAAERFRQSSVIRVSQAFKPR